MIKIQFRIHIKQSDLDQIRRQDPDPYQSEKQDQDPDPYQKGLDSQNCIWMSIKQLPPHVEYPKSRKNAPTWEPVNRSNLTLWISQHKYCKGMRRTAEHIGAYRRSKEQITKKSCREAPSASETKMKTPVALQPEKSKVSVSAYTNQGLSMDSTFKVVSWSN